MTSRAVVDLVAEPLRAARVKVGHAGTLDPLATGVLIVAVGHATRLIEYLQRLPKTYRAVVRLGATSDTNDADGAILENLDAPLPTLAQVQEALATQVGTILQRPPDVSALKVDGQRAYKLIRRGRPVDLPPRPVRIDRIDLLAYEWPRLEIEIVCGSGTYIRSIARDVGESLGCGGLIDALTRTRVGPFRIEDALDPLAVEWTSATIPGLLRPAVEALWGLPRARLDAEQVERVSRGQALRADQLADGPFPPGDLVLLGPEDSLVAVAEHQPEAGQVQPRRVLVPA
jgi:tRNA pseudouridine55 synthase